jgi:hypothetical protein
MVEVLAWAVCTSAGELMTRARVRAKTAIPIRTARMVLRRFKFSVEAGTEIARLCSRRERLLAGSMAENLFIILCSVTRLSNLR